MNKDKEQVVEYIEKASTVILGLLFIVFPIVFTNVTTDTFVLPKQIFLIFIVLALLILYGARTFSTQSLKIKRTPLDFPIILFGLATLGSVIFSISKFDSIYNYIPFLFAILSYFTITYNVRSQKSLTILVGSLLLGGGLTAVIGILNFLKVYVFPLDFAKFQTFTPLGSVLDQAIYLGLLIPLGAYFIIPYLKKSRSSIAAGKEENMRLISFGSISIVILVGFIVSIYSLISLQNPLILPIATGFQTAFAAISQDGGRVIQGFLFGSGFGEFSLVFLRFKQAAFNANPNIWNLTFFRSSTFVLELLSTTGIAGLLSFFFICYRILKQKPLFYPLIIFLAAAFFVPFAFYHVALLFFMLGLYSSFKALSNHQDYFDIELSLVASKKGFFVLSSEEVSSRAQEKYGKILASLVLAFIIIFSLIFGFLTYDFANGNVNFQKSVLAAAQNNGSATYTYQSNVLNSFTGKYIDAYYRVFSQTNLALANALSNSSQQGSSATKTTNQQTIYTLVQQSINAARSATTLSKNNASNWQNLSSIYRALIGFGQNADSFAILAAQQSVSLDPTNPQEYVNLGGIYFQLKNWDKALEEFQLAINLKPDFANAYYNHAHALEEKGDMANALTELNTVKQLVANDSANTAKINTEISDLEAKIKGSNSTPGNGSKSTLDVNQPSSTLPAQNPPVKIPGPTASVTPSPKETPEASPTKTP